MTIGEAVKELKSYKALYAEAQDLKYRIKEREYKLRSMGIYRMSDLPLQEKKDAADSWAKAFDEIKRLDDERFARIVEAERRAREIEEKASSLPYPYGRALTLKYIDGLSSKAVAKRMCYNPVYMKAVIGKAKAFYAEK